MVDPDLTRLSRFLSLILRHEPQKFGVALNEVGWTDVEGLLQACRKRGRAMDRRPSAIRAEGLKKMARHHVHLSADKASAVSIGQRHGKPAVLVVDAAAMVSGAFAFVLSANEVWLVDHVPVRFIRFPA